MSRRAVLTLLCLAALLALAVAPWTLSSTRLNDEVKRQLKDGYGLDVVASGRTTFALLPVPRLKSTNVTLANAEGAPLVRGAQLRSELRLLPLLAARFEIADLSIAEAKISLEISPDGATSWDAPIAKLKARAALAQTPSMHIRRLLVARSEVVVDDRRTGSSTQLAGVNLVVRWPASERGLDLSGSARWRGETVEVAMSALQPAALAAGRRSPVSLQARSRLGDIALTGEIGGVGSLHLNGRLVATAPALDAFCRWAGLARPLPGTGRPFAMAGEVAIGPDEIGLPQIRLTLGSEGFDGAVMLRHDGARPSVRATLAGDTLDLSPFLKPIASLGDTRVFKAADLDLLRSVDFDLRLSASAVEFGTVRLGDVATSVLTGADRIEMSLNRATVSGGTAKGRASLAFASDGYDAKAQGSFTGIEISSLLLALGQPRTITGAAQGQATLEAVGDSPEGLLRSLSGRAGILIRAGEISGVSLGEGLRRADDRAAAAATAWRSGRTPFQQLQLSFNLAGGMAEIADGSLDSAALHASLQGQVSLANRHAVLRARTGPPLDSAREGPTFVLDISGPWDRLQLVQNIDGLVQPSVAAPAHEER